MKKAVAASFHPPPLLRSLFSSLLVWLADSLLLLLPMLASCGDPSLPPASTQLSAVAKVEQWLSRLENSAAAFENSAAESSPAHSPETAVTPPTSREHLSRGTSAAAPLRSPSRAASATSVSALPSASAQATPASAKSKANYAATDDVKRRPDRPATGLTPYRTRDPSHLRTVSGGADGGATADTSVGATAKRVLPSVFFTPAGNAWHQSPLHPGKLDGTAARHQSSAARSEAWENPTAKHRSSAAGFAARGDSTPRDRSSAAGGAASDGATTRRRPSAVGGPASDGAGTGNRPSAAGAAALDGAIGGNPFSVVDHVVDRSAPPNAAAATSKRTEMPFKPSSGYPPSSTADQKEEHQRTWQAKQQQQQPERWNDAPAMTYTWLSLPPTPAHTSAGRPPFDAAAEFPTTSRASSRIQLPSVEPYNLPSPVEVYPVNQANAANNPGMGGAGYRSDAGTSSSFIDMLLKADMAPPHSSNTDSGKAKDSGAAPNVEQQQLPSAFPVYLSVDEMLQQLKSPQPVSTEATAAAIERQATTRGGIAEKKMSKEQRANSWRLMKFLDSLPATEANTLFFSPSVNTAAGAGRNGKTAEVQGASAAKNTTALAGTAAAGVSRRFPSAAPPQQSMWQTPDVLKQEAEVATGGRRRVAAGGRREAGRGDETEKADRAGSELSPLLSEYTLDTVAPDSARHLTRILRQMMSRPPAKQKEANMERQQQPSTPRRSATPREDVRVEQTPVIPGEELRRSGKFSFPKDQQQYAKLPSTATPTIEGVPQKEPLESVWLLDVNKGNGQRLSEEERKRWAMSPGGKDDGVTRRPGVKEGDVSGSAAVGRAEGQLGGLRGAADARPNKHAFLPFFAGQSVLLDPHQQYQSQVQALQPQQRPWLQPQEEEEDPQSAIFALLQQQLHPSYAGTLHGDVVPQRLLQLQSLSRDKLEDTGTYSSYSGSTTEDEDTFSTAGTTATATLQKPDEGSRVERAGQQTFQRRSQKAADMEEDRYAKAEKMKKHKTAEGHREEKERKHADEKKRKKKKKKGKKAHKGKGLPRHKAAAKPEHEHPHNRKLPAGAPPDYGKQKFYEEGVGAARAVVAGGHKGGIDAAAYPLRQGALPSKLPYQAPPVKPYAEVSHFHGDMPLPAGASMLHSPPAKATALEAPTRSPPAKGLIAGADGKKLAGDPAEDKHEGAAAAAAKPSAVVEAGVESTSSTGHHALDGQFLVSSAKERLDRDLGVRSRLERSDIVHVAWKALKAMAVTTSSNGRLLYLRLAKKLPWSWKRFVKELPAIDDHIIPEFRRLRRQLAEHNSEVLIVNTPSAALRHLIATEHPDAILTHGVVVKGRVIDSRRTGKSASEVNGLMKIVPKSPFMLSAYGAWVSHPELYSGTALLERNRKGSGGKGGADNRKEDGLSGVERLHRLYRKGKKEKKQKTEPMVLYVVTARARGDMDDYIHEQRHPIDVTVAAAEMLYSVYLLHKAGFLHRDIKLMNFFVTYEGHIELGDFDGVWPVGIPVSTKDYLLYTKGYLAPEVDIKQKFANYTPKSDIYALGICFKELHEAKPNMVNANLFKDLYKSMTAMNPETRPSAVQAMQHPFFKEIDFTTLEELKHKPPLPGKFAIRAGFYG